jgi:hypothetical protein
MYWEHNGDEFLETSTIAFPPPPPADDSHGRRNSWLNDYDDDKY